MVRWFNSTCYHPSPGNSRDRSSPLCRGWGTVLGSLVPGLGGGASKKIASCKWFDRFRLSNAMATHRLPDVKSVSVGKLEEFASAWLEQNNLSKLKSIFKGRLIKYKYEIKRVTHNYRSSTCKLSKMFVGLII